MDKVSTRGGNFDPEPGWARWKRRDQWQIDDAACLLVSASPDGWLGRWIKKHWHTDELKIEDELRSGSGLNEYRVPDELRDVVRTAIDIRDCAETSIQAGVLTVSDHFAARVSVDPATWLKWAEAKGYEIPSALAELLPPIPSQTEAGNVQQFRGGVTWVDVAYDKRLPRVSRTQADSESTPSGETKRVATLQKLVLAMAKAKYGWNSDNERNAATGTKEGSIYSDVVKHLGDSRRMTEDTIRDALQAANDQFPDKE